MRTREPLDILVITRFAPGCEVALMQPSLSPLPQVELLAATEALQMGDLATASVLCQRLAAARFR